MFELWRMVGSCCCSHHQFASKQKILPRQVFVTFFAYHRCFTIFCLVIIFILVCFHRSSYSFFRWASQYSIRFHPICISLNLVRITPCSLAHLVSFSNDFFSFRSVFSFLFHVQSMWLKCFQINSQPKHCKKRKNFTVSKRRRTPNTKIKLKPVIWYNT